jgi:hypothetical protein
LRAIEGAIHPVARGDVAAAWELLAIVKRIQAMIAKTNAALAVGL